MITIIINPSKKMEVFIITWNKIQDLFYFNGSVEELILGQWLTHRLCCTGVEKPHVAHISVSRWSADQFSVGRSRLTFSTMCWWQRDCPDSHLHRALPHSLGQSLEGITFFLLHVPDTLSPALLALSNSNLVTHVSPLIGCLIFSLFSLKNLTIVALSWSSFVELEEAEDRKWK